MTDVGWQPASQNWVNGGMQGMVQFGDDNKKFVVFYDRTVHNPAKSAESGRPEYDVKTFVRVQDPGDNLQIADRPAREDDRQRWPRHYQAYLEGRGTEQPGTPIELLFPANPELVAMFKHLKVTTIQALANCEGNALASIGMGAQEFKQKAVRYLEMAKEGEAYTKMEAQLASRDMEIAALKQQNTEITERLDRMLKMMEANAAGVAVAPIEPAPMQQLPQPGQKGVPGRRAPMGTGEI